MKTSLLSLFAGTMFLAGAAGAGAGEPVTLASTALDAISAGDLAASITQAVSQSIDADVDVTQSATATATATGIGNASASAVNASDVTIKNVNVARISQRN